MTNTNITNFRKNLFEYVDQAVTYGDVVNIATKHGNAVMMSEADYNGLMETLRLTSISGMTQRLRTFVYGAVLRSQSSAAVSLPVQYILPSFMWVGTYTPFGRWTLLPVWGPLAANGLLW